MRTYLTLLVLLMALALTGCCSDGSGRVGSLLDVSTPWGDLDLLDFRDDRLPAKPAPPPSAAKPDAAAP